MEVDAEENGAHDSSPVRVDEPDPRQSLQHVLSADAPVRPHSSHGARTSSKLNAPAKNTTIWIHEGGQEHTGDEGSVQTDSYTRASEVNPSHTMTVAHTRRNANGTIGSVYSGNKIRHLKKEDGIPLWRRDIQFAFLRAVFEDETPVFTKSSDKTKNHNFADIYIDAMARSSKTSKILKDKLLSDRAAAVNMAMVCLLVNVGRMNTTLNFFPEMRAQLRTYHSIPSLQAHQDPNAYKQLQDAPRLKSILKGASEDSDQPNTIEKIKAATIPRTNPVNLIFVLSQYAPKVSETHFYPPRDFFDLVMRSTMSSKSRARAFLWLVWWYLESDFTKEAAENNPFGRGQHGDFTDGLPLKVPQFDHLTEEQANAENVDTETEKVYGEMKRLERKRILEEDETVGPPMKRAKKNPAPAGGDEHLPSSPARIPVNEPLIDTDRTHSPSPVTRLAKPAGPGYGSADVGIHSPLHDDMTPTGTRRSYGHGRGPRNKPEANMSQRIILKTKMDQMPHSFSPAPPGAGHPVLHTSSNTNGVNQRRPRPETSHQKAVNLNRTLRMNHILHNQLGTEHERVRKRKRFESSSYGFLAMKRIINLPDGYDSEDEHSYGPGGLVPNSDEEEDYGEEALRGKKQLDRAIRRLDREGHRGPLGGLLKTFHKRKRPEYESGDEDDHGQSRQRSAKARKSNGSAGHALQSSRSRGDEVGREEGLDDLDLDLLGESRGEEEQVDEEMEEGEGEGEGDSGMDDESEGGGDEQSDEEGCEQE
ncbi:hypothetical protein LPUS_07289 [Lasallia pustulata]|uniref:Ino eighty subunit 1 n=1 Tax=Lasallia pustulata TaxID=136370 RepID=A0A1W5D3C1_9LECA|nr:hypothetical protein LPUS_07289 [Lasallia pustulata]